MDRRGPRRPSPNDQIELHRDRIWRRDEDLGIESAVDAKRFIENVGFANTLTDGRRADPSIVAHRLTVACRSVKTIHN
jgi:hypothetical protein